MKNNRKRVNKKAIRRGWLFSIGQSLLFLDEARVEGAVRVPLSPPAAFVSSELDGVAEDSGGASSLEEAGGSVEGTLLGSVGSLLGGVDCSELLGSVVELVEVSGTVSLVEESGTGVTGTTADEEGIVVEGTVAFELPDDDAFLKNNSPPERYSPLGIVQSVFVTFAETNFINSR